MTIKRDNCKKCISRCIHAGEDRDFVCINGVSCKITIGKSQTNADRIRSMSDEELAKFLGMCESMGYKNISIATDSGGHCMDMFEWLKQPAEEDDHAERNR